MKDMSSNLPTWAWFNGYRLSGEGGTYGSLWLWKDTNYVKDWNWEEGIPNIMDIGDVIEELEGRNNSPTSLQ